MCEYKAFFLIIFTKIGATAIFTTVSVLRLTKDEHAYLLNYVTKKEATIVSFATYVSICLKNNHDTWTEYINKSLPVSWLAKIKDNYAKTNDGYIHQDFFLEISMK